MKEKLIIRNFGPIKSVELDLGRFNVLIGEQATGKSTVAKVLALCRDLTYIIENNPEEEQSFKTGLEYYGLHEAAQEGTYIHYDCFHYSFTIERFSSNEIEVFNNDSEDGVKTKVFYYHSTLKHNSEDFRLLLKELEDLKANSPGFVTLSQAVLPLRVQNRISTLMDSPFYLPSERGLQSIFSLGRSTIQNMSDLLFNQLAQIDLVARLFKKETLIEPLDIIYKNVDGKGYIRKKDEDRFFSLFNAASGYQSTIPVVLSVKNYSEPQVKGKTFIVDEPELNIFPNVQRRLVNYLADSCVNCGNPILLTTHSPYILTSLNNLAYAYSIGKRDKEKTAHVIDERYWINPEDISAYMLKSDGTYEDILDRETGLIKAEKIDQVSDELNEQFNALINVEFEKK